MTSTFVKPAPYRSLILYPGTSDEIDAQLCRALGYESIASFHKLIGKKHKNDFTGKVANIRNAIDTHVVPRLVNKAVPLATANMHVISDLHDVLDFNVVNMITGVVNDANANVYVERVNALVDVCNKNGLSFNVMSYVGMTSTMVLAYYTVKPLLENGFVSSLTLCSLKAGSLSENTKGWCTQNFFNGTIVATFDDDQGKNGVSFNLAAPGSFMYVPDSSGHVLDKMVQHVVRRLKYV